MASGLHGYETWVGSDMTSAINKAYTHVRYRSNTVDILIFDILTGSPESEQKVVVVCRWPMHPILAGAG